MLYSNSYYSDSNFKPGDFVLSSVNSADLVKYGIKGSVKDFKERVKKSKKYKVIETGGNGYRRHTFVYNFNDFIHTAVVTNPVINYDYWWND